MNLLDAAIEFYSAEQDMHKMYGSTSTCRGGVGGAAMTMHCTHTCRNPEVHDAAREAYHTAKRDLFYAIEAEQARVAK